MGKWSGIWDDKTRLAHCEYDIHELERRMDSAEAEIKQLKERLNNINKHYDRQRKGNG